MDDSTPPLATLTSRTHTPESLRQRQRDRHSPRRRSVKTSSASSSSRELDRTQKQDITLTRAPKSGSNATRSPDLTQGKQMQDGLRKAKSIKRRVNNEVDEGKNDITPDGGSGRREGRQFAVAKVGNNGKIYLRPTIRPANERYAQPPFTFPITPPSSAGLDTLIARNESHDSEAGSLCCPTRPPPTKESRNCDQYPSKNSRDDDQSDLDEQYLPDAGAFKIIIERSGSGPKPSISLNGIPTLEVPIPSYKLGTPRFSVRGTAFLRGSSYTTTTDDVRSSTFSKSRDSSAHRRIISRRHSDASPQMLQSDIPTSPLVGSSESPAQRIIVRTTISPGMYDALTFKPECDHPSVVRYVTGGSIRAATPARLVAEITSPTFVDYDLLSDFFLTFRTFLDPSDLLFLLIARLKWALLRNDEIGTVVRVRAFVALRHWILNYFLDDFVVDYDLRVSFCDLLNNFARDVNQDPSLTKIPLKIFGELKKCWRRVCALYWDGPEFDVELGHDVPIHPGGVSGSRNATLDPSFWKEGPPRLDGIIEPDFIEPDSETADRQNYFADVSRAGRLEHISTPYRRSSMVSEDFVSCSFPSRVRGNGTRKPVGAHPVPASSSYDTSPIATIPRALSGKRIRPTHGHKRSASFSDSFRDRRVDFDQPVQKVIYKSTELHLALPYAGSLVRGNLLPPGQAFVDIIAPCTPAEKNRQSTLFVGTPSHQKGPSAMSGPGMKRLLGSVRRALRNRPGLSPTASPTHGSFPNIPPLGIRGATINRLPGTAIVPQARHRNTGGMAPMRIDLLGAEIADDFKKAVREDAEAEQLAATQYRHQGDLTHDAELNDSVMVPDTTYEYERPAIDRAPPSEVTTGSKSIVIVDDTIPFQMPIMTGALPIDASLDTFADIHKHPSGGPTPPSTPPEAHMELIGGSSGQHTRDDSHSFEQTPSLVIDSRPSGDDERSPSHKTPGGQAFRRGLSCRQSKRSVSLRRYASYHTGLNRQQSERSFDASTFSELEQSQPPSEAPSVPLPLRVLRRRPGGNLRGVSHVEDLDSHPLRRPMSTGSLTTYSESVRSSFLFGHDSTVYIEAASREQDLTEASQTFSLGALAEQQPKTCLSLFSTHSSQPVMRPSFEKEAQMLAQIPDDDDDDGGVESALLKLEGKYEKRNSDISGQAQSQDGLQYNTISFGNYHESAVSVSGNEEKRRHRQKHIVESTMSKTPPPFVETYRPKQVSHNLEELKPAVYQPRGMVSQPPRPVVTDSVQSYNSMPLLERGLTDNGEDWSNPSDLRAASHDGLGVNVQTPESYHVNSYEFVKQTESMNGKESRGTENQSILGSKSDDRSDLSSEMSLEVISRTDYTARDSTSTHAFPPLQPASKDMGMPPQSLEQPLSPPITMIQALQLSPTTGRSPNLSERQLEQGHQGLLPTPEVSPTATVHVKRSGGASGVAPATESSKFYQIQEPSRKNAIHLPFTLAFDSQVLAQQFTLIEKDALNEIDWKDLIEMRWKDTNSETRSWVNFLRNSEPRGVEVVIVRFNIMVKWAVSECVLTQDLGERVRTIIKYIHIAAHCRKYRNFATMTQLTVALTSKDITRLTKTWAHVPASDLETLKELETLVTPTHNFHNLRAEMEGTGADLGCIPFVGIYTHDLLVNSERPSQIAGTPITEPLVNFEKCRTDAAIVKNLLRLLEASQLYRFVPIEGITERCLWMATLSDEDIDKHGRLIQP